MVKREAIPFYENDSHLRTASAFLYGNLLWWMPLMSSFAVSSGIPFYVIDGGLIAGLFVGGTRERILKLDSFFRDHWRKHREGVWISKILRDTMLGCNLGYEEKVRKQIGNDTVYEIEQTFPKAEILKDSFNYYLRFKLLPGQMAKEWMTKAESFSHAFELPIVKTKVDTGYCMIVLQHQQLDSSFVPKKTDASHSIALGYRLGERFEWEFNEFPHCLIVGLTGSGKSTFVRNLLIQFDRDWIVKIVDGKFVEFSFMKRLGYDVATSETEFISYVEEAHQEVIRRFEEMKNQDVNDYRDLGYKPYFLLVDEFIFLVETLSTKKDKETGKTDRDKLFDKLRDIALRGRSAGVNLILILQRPDSSFLPTVIRENLTTKIVLGGSETAFDMAFGSENKKLQRLPKGEGYILKGQELTNFSFANYSMENFKEDLQSKDTEDLQSGEMEEGIESRQDTPIGFSVDS